MSALGALGSGVAHAATPTDLGGPPSGHTPSTVDRADLSRPASSAGSDLHSFSMPTMDTHTAAPGIGRTDDYNDNGGYNDNGYGNGYNDNGYGNNGYNYSDSNYGNRYDNGYNNYDNYDNGYRRDGNGLLGGGLLGGNN